MLGIWSYSRHPNYFGEVCALLFPLSLCSLSLMTTGFYPGELTLFHEKNLQMLLWWGLYVICVPTLRGPQHLACLSPIFLTYLLCFVSGIPILERSAEKKWGEFFSSFFLSASLRHLANLLFHPRPLHINRIAKGIQGIQVEGSCAHSFLSYTWTRTHQKK